MGQFEFGLQAAAPLVTKGKEWVAPPVSKGKVWRALLVGKGKVYWISVAILVALSVLVEEGSSG